MESKPTSSSEPRGGGTKDIWLLLSSMEPAAPVKVDATSDAMVATAPSAVEERDSFTLFLGSKKSGKTSLCNALMRRGDDKASGEDVKSTIGLEYLFVRQNNAVAHMWELAMTRCVPEMMRVPLAPERIFQSACVVVVDLSTPGDALPYLIKWLTTVHKIVNEVLKAKEKNPVEKAAVERLKKQALARYGKDHEDRKDVSPIAIPVLVIGTKLDEFATKDSALRKPLQQALRFFSHLFGATLLFTSVKEKPLVLQMRSVLKAYIFGTSANLQGMKKEVDSVSKPLFVPAGSDRFADIGFPNGVAKQDWVGPSPNDANAMATLWKEHVANVAKADPKGIFAPSGTVTDGWEDRKDAKDQSPESEFPEPNVDRARQRKLEELTRYRDAAQKKGDKSKSIKP